MREPVEIALFTDDVEATKSFYGRLVGAGPEAEWPGGAIFAVGALELLVHERSGAIKDGPPNELAAYVESRSPLSSLRASRSFER